VSSSPGEPGLLSIVIPALNEEQSISGTVQGCLAAREEILKTGGLRAVEVIVVSDGSHDGTERLALAFPEVTVLAFERNRGYGAAIKCGFAHSGGEIVGFLDADGTCDPVIFGALCRALVNEGASVALGSRMGPGSAMPWIRTLGNALFAWMLGLLSRRRVHDTASGMRVIRRADLGFLYPLPDGLHFTPAMSARVLLEDRLRLVEVPMPYAERVGRSKLSVVRDGVRFLSVIGRAAFTYRPGRPLLLLAALSAAGAFVVGIQPLVLYAQERRLEEWMIYRVLLASLLTTVAVVVGCTAAVAERMAALLHGRDTIPSSWIGWVSSALSGRRFWLGVASLGAVAVAFVWPGLLEYAATGHVNIHWSRVVMASLLLVVAAAFSSSVVLMELLELIRAQRRETDVLAQPDRVRWGSARRA
jgi:hypothetical protein